MSEAVTSNAAAPITLLGEWPGPAVNHPALAGDEKTLEGFLADPTALASVAIWVGVTLGSAVLGNASGEPVNQVVAFLAAWRRRHGQAKLDKLKCQVLDELNRGKASARIAPDEIRRRLDVLFDQVST